MQKTRIKLNDLARLSAQLRADSETPLRSLQERDRGIATQITATSPAQKIKAWLDLVDPSPGRYTGIEAAVSFWLCIAGTVCGIVAMSGLLLVDNQHPVNVLLFLTLFIGIQLLLLVLTLVVGAALGAGVMVHLPLEGINPARLLFRRVLNRLTGTIRWENFTDVIRLALMRWGQLFGVAFNIGGVIAFLIILTVTDRNFGWSSTFNISNEALAHVVAWLALPWSDILPSATVNADVVAMTRFQNLLPTFNANQVTAMRAWWPFLLTCIIVYGLLPRAVLAIVFHLLYRRRLQQAFIHFPGVNLLLSRMDSPVVHTQATSSQQQLKVSSTAITAAIPKQQITAVSWVGAADNDRQSFQNTGLNIAACYRAGFDLNDDQQLLQLLNQQSAAVVIAVKSWEPPLADLGDFIDELNDRIECYLLLLPLHGDAVSTGELRDWRLFCERHPRRALGILIGGSGPEGDE